MSGTNSPVPTIRAFKRNADLLERAWDRGQAPALCAAVDRFRTTLPYYQNGGADILSTPPTRSRVLHLLAAEAGHPSWDSFAAEQSRPDIAANARYLIALEEEIMMPSHTELVLPGDVVMRAGGAVVSRFVFDRSTGRVVAFQAETAHNWAWVPDDDLELCVPLLTTRIGEAGSAVDRLTKMVIEGTTRDAYLSNVIPAWVGKPSIGVKPPVARWRTGVGVYGPEVSVDEAGDRGQTDDRYARHFPAWRLLSGAATLARVAGRRGAHSAFGGREAALMDHTRAWRTPEGELVVTAEPYQTAVDGESLVDLMRLAAKRDLTVERDGYSPYYPGATVLFVFRRRRP